MTYSSAGFHGSIDLSEQLELLRAACEWAEISQGRAGRYGRLMSDFYAGKATTREQILAYFEGLEISELYQLWKDNTDMYPGLKGKIREAINKGPLLREDENSDRSTNAPRNNAFTCLIAGRLVAAGIGVLSVDGVLARGQTISWKGDATCESDGEIVDVQCKRPQRMTSLETNVRKAYRQILDAKEPGQGIVAIDISLLVHPPGTLLSARSEDEGYNHVKDLVSKTLTPNITKYITKSTKILGMLAFAVVPMMIERRSILLSPSGKPFTFTLPYSGADMLFLASDDSPKIDLIRSIALKLDVWLRRKTPQGWRRVI